MTDTKKTVAKTQTFTLEYPYTLADGRVLSTITLRRGTVADMRRASRGSDGNNEAYELNLIASLTEEALTPEDLEGMDMDDYAQIQEWFRKRKS